MPEDKLSKIVGFGAGRTSVANWLKDQPSDSSASLDQSTASLVRRSREMLYRAFNLRTTVVIAGAGITAPVYKGWWHLANDALTNVSKKHLVPESCRTLLNLSPTDAGHFLWVLQQVHDLCKQDENQIRFHEWLGKRFLPPLNQATDLPGLRALLKLPVHRFATTNYDVELECGLLRESGGFNREAFRTLLQGETTDARFIDPGFTQLSKHSSRLAEFAVAIRNADRPLVFHMHGRCDEQESLIATESDYRRFYLSPQNEAGRVFRHAVQLLLTSNPLLFVGFGLRDPDFMRTLEFLRASDDSDGDERAVFALMPEFELRDAFTLRSNWATATTAHPIANPTMPTVDAAVDYYWQRYGVHILPYPCDGSHKVDEEFPNAIDQLHADYQAWRTRWQRKPQLRTAQVSADEGSFFAHPEPAPSKRRNPLILGGRAVSLDMAELAHALGIEVEEQGKAIGATVPNGLGLPLCSSANRPGVVVLLGIGGCGKSYRALRLYEALKDTKQLGRFKKCFFWSTYYADDWLTGVDSLLKFLETTPGNGSRLDRLQRALDDDQGGAALVIFDGFERVLAQARFEAGRTEPEQVHEREVGEARPTKVRVQPAEMGDAYGTAVHEFLRVVANAKSATIILTSRLWPRILGNPDENGVVKRKGSRPIQLLRVEPLSAEDIAESGKEFVAGVDGLPANRVCSLLGGHAYSLRLAAWVAPRLKGLNPSRDLCQELEWVPPHGRPGRLIDLCIDAISKRPPSPDAEFITRVLERVAVFMSPITTDVWDACVSQANEPGGSGATLGATSRMLLMLIKSGLMEKVRVRQNPAYTLHPVVRGHVFHRLHGSKGQEMPNFTLAGFTTGAATVDPGAERGREVVKRLFWKLHEEAQEYANKGMRAKAVGFCRAAFSVMRARMEATAAARWDQYGSYIERSVRLANLVKRLANEREDEQVPRDEMHGLWSQADVPALVGASSIMSDDGVLHAEELAWLVNDLGLACCCEGNMYDALAVWSYGYEINRVIERGEVGGQFIVQSQLHLGHSYLELGELAKAREYLEMTERSNQVLGSDDYRARINGYMGVLEHLSGDTRAAEERYRTSLNLLEARPNPRATSIFLRHRADLFILTGDLKEANEYARRALGIAQANGYPDLAAFCHNTIGHIRRARKDWVNARIEYDIAIREARRIGIRRLEADILSEMARLALTNREPEAARSNAMRSLRIANECGLGLRQCHALVALGLATDMAGDRSLGIQYLRVAGRMCERAAYWLRKQEVDLQLGAWGVGNITD